MITLLALSEPVFTATAAGLCETDLCALDIVL